MSYLGGAARIFLYFMNTSKDLTKQKWGRGKEGYFRLSHDCSLLIFPRSLRIPGMSGHQPSLPLVKHFQKELLLHTT